MSDVWKKIKGYLITGFICLIIGAVGTGIFAYRYYLRQSRSDRELTGQLSEQIRQSADEVAGVRAELGEARDEIHRIRESLGECRDLVESGYSEFDTIRGAVAQIRKQTEILQKFYDSVGDIYDSIPDYDNNTDKNIAESEDGVNDESNQP